MGKRNSSKVCRFWSGAAAAVAIVGTASAQDVSGQDVSGQDVSGHVSAPTQLEEIVVTAQKRTERLLDVPVPVTAVASGAMVQQNLVTLQDYSTRVPSLRVTSDRIAAISIRGVTAFTGNPTTAVTVDDVPFGPSSGDAQGIFPDFDPADLARIEVLRGPQGTLYGASAMGGLIKYVTVAPDPTKLSGRVEMGVSQAKDGGDGYSARGSANIPLWQDKLAVRVSGFKRKDPAYLDSVNPQVDRDDVNDYEVEGGRAAILFRPIDELTINVSHMEQTLDQGIVGATLLTPYPTDFKPLTDYHDIVNGDAETHNEHKLTQVRVEWQLPFTSVTSVSAWGETGGGTDSDVSTSFPFVFSLIYPGSPAGSQARIDNVTRTEKFSQELRFASVGQGRLEWLLGGFYTDEDIDIFQDLKAFGPSGSLLGDVITFPNRYTLEEHAVFGSVTWHFTDRFNVELGGRYAEVEQTSRAEQRVAQAAVPLFGASYVDDLLHASETATTWLVSPQYRINDNVMVYGRAATGYRPGGTNSAFAPNATYESDSVINYELGVKGQFFARRLTLDASVFDIEWEDIQLGVATPANLGYTVNSGKARIRGVEAAAQLAVGDGWRFSANVALNDAELREDFPILPGGAPTTLAFAGSALPDTAKFSGNVGIEKSWDIFADYSFVLGGNYSHVGKRATAYRSSTAAPSSQARFDLPSYDVVDLYATLGNDTWNANVYVRNAGDERGLIRVNDGGGRIPTMNGYFIAPRIVGVNLSWSF